MNIGVIGINVLRATLEASAPYAAAMAWTGGLTKTFGTLVPASAEPPYVVIEHYTGGLDNDAKTQAADVLFKVCVLTNEDEAAALSIATLIYNALHRVDPVVPVDATYGGYHWIELVYPYNDLVNRQGVTFLSTGGIYRLSLAETA